MLYFLSKLLRQGILLVGLRFIFWEGYLHHVELSHISFWMCFRKHLKYQGFQDNNWKICITFSGLMTFFAIKILQNTIQALTFFSAVSLFVADGNVHTNLKDLHLRKKYKHLIIQVYLQNGEKCPSCAALFNFARPQARNICHGCFNTALPTKCSRIYDPGFLLSAN